VGKTEKFQRILFRNKSPCS